MATTHADLAPTRILQVGASLAFVAGFVDASGFVALFGLFTAHVTGNLIMIGVELAQGGPGVFAKLCALPVFMAAVLATSLIVDACNSRGMSPLRPLLVAQLLLLLGFMAAGLAWPPRHADGWREITTGMLAVLAMGVQNAKSRLVLSSHIPTTVMTGTVTQLMIDLIAIVRPGPAEPRRTAAARARKSVPALLAFAAGAIGGAISYLHLSFWCVLIPLAVLIALIATTPGARPPAPGSSVR
ncbi:YoaK family protein [Sphingomonas sp.]|uniref:YoaK family protein n=1 Tax=Sphingomonas sp. TaxID=28214 RepID=UPI001DF28FD3|nr:YoaK family protein [Sphingomonas sp.]MBX9796408.1 DUF1275 domain-containing protein [Sphingomonas sp.]